MYVIVIAFSDDQSSHGMRLLSLEFLTTAVYIRCGRVSRQFMLQPRLFIQSGEPTLQRIIDIVLPQELDICLMIIMVTEGLEDDPSIEAGGDYPVIAIPIL